MISTLLKNYRLQTGKYSTRIIVLCSLAFVLFSTNSIAQVTNYTLNQLQLATYTPLVAPPATNIAATAGNIDNAVATAVPLGFTFQYNGASYATVNISMNGFVTFGTAPALTEVTPISSATGYSGVIAPFAMDLDLVPASVARNVSYVVSGTAPNRIFQVQWNVKRSNNLGTAADAGGGNDTQFQLWLYETTNVIEMHYQTNNTSSTFNALGQVGLRGTTNADFLNLDYNVGVLWPGLAPAPLGTIPFGATNAAQVLFRNTCRPSATSNRLFRWTPVTCSAPTGLAVTAGSITSSTASISWNAAVPVPGIGYDYYVTSSAVPPTLATTPTGSTVPATLSANLTGLASATLHYVYVRSVCSGSSTSSWSSAVTFTTFCNPVNVPYLQEFDNGVGVNPVFPHHTNIPTCTSQQNAGLGNNWVTADQDLYYTNAFMTFNILMYNGQSPGNANPANVWWYTEGINLVAGTTYTINYLYGGSSVPSTVQNRMRVAYGTYPAAANMTTILDDHPNIKSSSFTNFVNFTAPSTGVFYFGFQCYSNPNNGQLFVDDVQIYPSVCLKPTAVSVSAITGTTALLSWTPPTPAPASGYAYYFSTSSTPPTNSTVPSGFTAAGVNSVTLTGLSGSTTYYFWVRANCGFGEFGEWEALNNAGNPFFTTLVAPIYCTPNSTSGLSFINNFTTTGGVANINNSSGFTTGGYQAYLSQIVSQSPNSSINFSVGISGPTVGVAIWVDWNNNGTFEAGERMFNTTGFVTGPATGSFTVPAAQPLGSYRMRVFIDFWGSNPTNPCAFSVTGPRGEAEDYTFTVLTPPPPIAITPTSSIQCAGVSSPTINLTTPIGNFDSYTWSPAIGVSGNAVTGWTLTSGTSLTYTLTGTQTSAPFSTNSVTYNYTANALPTPITITTPSGTVACPAGSSPAIPLVASGGIVSGFPIYYESFNSGAPGWTNTNTSTGGIPANATWTIRPAGYNAGGSSGIPSVISNDNSACYISNSDSQGAAGITNVELISPVFSLGGYTSAALSFFHFVRFFQAVNSPFARVLISLDGGVTYPDLLQEWVGVTNNQNSPPGATATNFANTIIDLTSYVGQTNVRIKFVYFDRFGYIWAIDNFLITGSAASSVTWNTQVAPVANGTAVPGLFTTALADTPYIAGSGTASVFALPAAATTFTATASTPAPVCTTTTPISVTINPILGGTASNNQTICGGTASNLTLTGHVGTITGWQSADNLAFTVGLVNIPASASATLTSAQMGTITTTKYFRAVITNALCTSFSSVVTISVNSTTWNGSAWSAGVPNATTDAIFNGNFISTGNINACSVRVTSGNVVFNPNHALVVQNAVNVIGGTLTFENNSSLVQINNSVNTGNITYRRNTTPVRRFDYTYWSSPVSPQTLFNLSPLTLSDKYFFYDTTINNWQQIPSSNLMVPGTGYIVRAPQPFSDTVPSIYNASFVGVPNNGTIPTNIGVGLGTINCIGNPYPSAIDADLFITDPVNDPLLEGTLYFWTHNTPITSNNYFFNDYAIYTLAGGLGTIAAPNVGTGNNTVPTGDIAAGQGFMIAGTTPGNNNVFFRNSMRLINNNSQFYRLGSDDRTNTNTTFSIEKHRVWLEVFNNDGAYKQAMVGYIENASNGYEEYDGKVFDIGNPVFLYSMVEDNKLGIQARALPFDVNDTVPLGFKSTVNGNYEFKLADFDGLFENQEVYIEDLYTNTIHNLKLSNYSFSTQIGTFEDRFVLRFTNSVLSINETIFNDNSVIIYKENKDIIINSLNAQIKTIEIHDVRGRQLIGLNDLNVNQYVVSNLNSSQQVLIVSVTSTDGKKVTKKIIF